MERLLANAGITSSRYASTGASRISTTQRNAFARNIYSGSNRARGRSAGGRRSSRGKSKTYLRHLAEAQRQRESLERQTLIDSLRAEAQGLGLSLNIANPSFAIPGFGYRSRAQANPNAILEAQNRYQSDVAEFNRQIAAARALMAQRRANISQFDERLTEFSFEELAAGVAGANVDDLRLFSILSRFSERESRIKFFSGNTEILKTLGINLSNSMLKTLSDDDDAIRELDNILAFNNRERYATVTT
jgi:hypothetical protein